VRELKTCSEISDWLTRTLVTRLRGGQGQSAELVEPDAEGSNWSRDLILNYGRDDSVMSTGGPCSKNPAAVSTSANLSAPRIEPTGDYAHCAKCLSGLDRNPRVGPVICEKRHPGPDGDNNRRQRQRTCLLANGYRANEGADGAPSLPKLRARHSAHQFHINIRKLKCIDSWNSEFRRNLSVESSTDNPEVHQIKDYRELFRFPRLWE
jgi:hypothetical protein